MIVSNEPGYYKTGAYGIRIENLVLVQPWEGAASNSAGDDGAREMLCFETLTLAPIDRALVATDLLDADETAWLDSYHQRVRAELLPLVDSATARWLEQATAPLSRN
jgi:Xaa-Pro aminopeptidase